MSDFTFEIQGVKEMQARFAQSPILMQEVANDTLQAATFIAETAAKQNAPVDTGILRGSIHSDVRNMGSETVGIVGTNLEYAPYQEFGTGIYGPSGSPIVPVQASVLAFMSKTGGMIFARSVSGAPARHFMAAGLEAVKNNMSKIRSIGLQAAKRKLGL